MPEGRLDLPSERGRTVRHGSVPRHLAFVIHCSRPFGYASLIQQAAPALALITEQLAFNLTINATN